MACRRRISREKCFICSTRPIRALKRPPCAKGYNVPAKALPSTSSCYRVGIKPQRMCSSPTSSPKAVKGGCFSRRDANWIVMWCGITSHAASRSFRERMESTLPVYVSRRSSRNVNGRRRKPAAGSEPSRKVGADLLEQRKWSSHRGAPMPPNNSSHLRYFCREVFHVCSLLALGVLSRFLLTWPRSGRELAAVARPYRRWREQRD